MSIHKAEPQDDSLGVSACRHCGAPVKRVPGGQGPTWIHTETGAVVGSGPVRIDGRTFEQWATELFEYELCNECGGDAEDHEPQIVMGHWFAHCTRAHATIMQKGRGWVTIAHHPGGIDTTIGRFTAKYQAKACADKFNNAQTRQP